MAYKIGILTLFKSNNYGTFLQCFSLVNQLKKYSELDIEVINCVSLQTEKNMLLSIRDSYSKINSFKTLIRYLKLRKTAVKLLPLSKKSFTGNNHEKAMNFIDKQGYDAIIVGSDELWKVLADYRFPGIYWLDSTVKAKKISYAVSANRTDFNVFSNTNKDFIHSMLDDFDYLGVRDNTTKNELNKINPNAKFYKNPDPTFMYEFIETPNLENKVFNKYKVDKNKPIIGITMRDPDMGKAIIERFGQKYEIVSIFRSNPCVKKYICDLDYFEWANIFGLFAGTITDLYHGTIFSLKNSTPFVSVDNSELYTRYPGKIEDLLVDINMQDSYFNVKDANFSLDKMLDKLESNIEQKADKIIQMKQQCDLKKRESYNCIATVVEHIVQSKKNSSVII